MRQRFFPQTLFVSLCLILCVTFSAQAQSMYIPITSNNAAQITQLSRIGSGVPRMMMFAPDGKRLAIATALGVWVIETASPSGTRSCTPANSICHLIDGQGGAESVVFSPDGSMIAAGGEDNSVIVFDAATDKVIKRLEDHIYPISAVAWSDDDKWVASGDWSGVVRIWDTAAWSEYRVLTTTEKIDHLIFDNLTLTAYTIQARTDWDVNSGEVVGRGEPLNYGSYIIEAGTVGNYAGWSVQDAQIAIWDRLTSIATLNDFYSELNGVYFTLDGRVGASFRQTGYLWSLDGKPSDKAPSPVLSPDGTRLATFGNDGVIHLKDAKSGDEIAALHGHIRAVTDVAFSPDGRLLVSSSNDGTIQVWDATVTQDSGSLATLTGHNGGVSSVAFNADGTLIASAGYDGTVRLWGIKA
jgi:WD40 repeat protein